MKQALLYFASFIGVQLITAFIVQTVVDVFMPSMNENKTQILLITAALSAIILILLFAITKWCPMSRNYVRSRPWSTLFWTVLLGIGIVLPLTWMEEMLPDFMKVNLISKELTEMLKSTEGYFVICMLSPLMEEIIFRGAIIRKLISWGEARKLDKTVDIDLKNKLNTLHSPNIKWTAIIISTLLFSIAHMNPAQIPHAFLVGILLGWLFTKTGSIVPGLIIHWINNSSAYVISNIFPTIPTDADLATYFGGSQIAVAQAVVCSLLIALPALYQLITKK